MRRHLILFLWSALYFCDAAAQVCSDGNPVLVPCEGGVCNLDPSLKCELVEGTEYCYHADYTHDSDNAHYSNDAYDAHDSDHAYYADHSNYSNYSHYAHDPHYPDDADEGSMHRYGEGMPGEESGLHQPGVQDSDGESVRTNMWLLRRMLRQSG